MRAKMGSAKVGSSLACKYQTRVEVINTLAYNIAVTDTTKSFITQMTVAMLWNYLWNKLERFSCNDFSAWSNNLDSTILEVGSLPLPCIRLANEVLPCTNSLAYLAKKFYEIDPNCNNSFWMFFNCDVVILAGNAWHSNHFEIKTKVNLS
jgi:hypothetical protein